MEVMKRYIIYRHIYIYIYIQHVPKKTSRIFRTNWKIFSYEYELKPNHKSQNYKKHPIGYIYRTEGGFLHIVFICPLWRINLNWNVFNSIQMSNFSYFR